jgi:DNA-binding NtrC family response regulator
MRTPQKMSAPITGRILLVEDHALTANSLARLLKQRGYDVHIAGNCFTAMQAIHDGKFDAMICDLGLPDGTGWDLLQEVKRVWPTVPAVAVSGFGTQEDVQRSLAAGFISHQIKPITIQRLVDALRKALGSERAAQGA